MSCTAMYKRLRSLLSKMKGADLNISDRVIRLHVVQISEIQDQVSALENFERCTSSIASNQKPVSEYGRVSLASALVDEERLYEPLFDLEMQAVQGGNGIPDEFGGRHKLSRHI